MSGIVDDPAAGWDPLATGSAPGGSTPGHAVAVVGFEPSSSEPTGGWFIFRNSMGLNFGRIRDGDAVPQVPADGFGAISATYVENYCWELLSPINPSR